MDSVDARSSSEPFRFNGSGSEYFGIWIVNVLLTIVTFGIYSPWAKVRRMQYFYRNTELAGSTFDYHGRPLAILKGRLIALGLFVLYHFATTYASLWTLAVLAILALALPWLLRNALRFRAQYSSYRGLRFSFRGSLRQSYAVFLGYPLLMLVTAYIAGPLFHQRLKRYQHGHGYYGGTGFSFDASVGRFYRTYIPYMLVGLVIMALAFVPMFRMFGAIEAAKTAGTKPDPTVVMSAMSVFWLAILFSVLVLGPMLQAAVQNLIWNHTALGPHRFVSRLTGMRLMWIAVSNFLLVALTLGLFMPWAVVRLARYRADCMSLEVNGSLDAIVADAEQQIAAVGEETAELFDIDIGL